MKNKNLIYLIILVVLLAVAGWLITSKNDSGTLERKMDYNFTIKDTANIDKIIIKDKSPAEVTLTREGKEWVLDNEFRARRGAVNTLLGTLYRMELRNFVPEKMKEIVLKRMTVFGKEVQIYKNGELFKTFYVGTETPDELGTYMMIKGSDAPYAVYMPGFNGFLSTRFFTQQHLWKSRDVTRMDPRNIREISMVYPDSSASSFKIQMFSPDSIFVTQLSTGKVLRNVNMVKTRLYIGSAARMKYEGAILPTDPIFARRDSLLASTPVFEITVKDTNGKTTTLEGYHIKAMEGMINDAGVEHKYDPDRMHGFINKQEMVLLQYAGLIEIIKPINYFATP